MAEVGARIICEGYYGTVMYVGPVKGSEGSWVGVRWDDIERGKHDGEYNGTRYFTCEPGHGSFARPAKLNFGISLASALKSKYVTETTEEADESEMYVTTVRHEKVQVELVGREKARKQMQKLDILPVADLSGMLVSQVDPDLASLIPRVRELDLSGALLHSWDQIFDLLAQLQGLNVLCLNNVVLAPPTKSPIPTFDNLHILVLNRTKIPWKQVLTIRCAFPKLQELHLSENNISQFIDTDTNNNDVHNENDNNQNNNVNTNNNNNNNENNNNSNNNNSTENDKTKMHTYEKVTGFDELQLLNLEGNVLKDWNEICRFSQLPKLQHIILSSNQLATIYHDRTPTMFATLESISIAHNRISSWDPVNELHFFPSHKRLRMTGNPVLASLAQTVARLYIIGRIGNLTVLNGANVKPTERLDAERYYLRNIISTRTQDSNPRFQELMAKHGGPDGINTENTALITADKQFFSLTLRGPLGEQKKTIPGTMTVKELKHLCTKVLNLPTLPQTIFLQTPTSEKSEVFPVELSEENMHMFDAGIVDSSVVICSGK
eukprot:Phypoly_transcript_06342.p1 GENE.Phypoly_transcript_06342~~Phypoly_transcript_06342.p1  ORF type:complete len:550 (+),score=86.33 Phypoly_transcript_06342:139-1788(+)